MLAAGGLSCSCHGQSFALEILLWIQGGSVSGLLPGLEGSYPAARGPSSEVEGILVTSLPLLLEMPVASVSGAPHRPGLPGKPLSHDPLLPEFVFLSSPRGLSP